MDSKTTLEAVGSLKRKTKAAPYLPAPGSLLAPLSFIGSFKVGWTSRQFPVPHTVPGNTVTQGILDRILSQNVTYCHHLFEITVVTGTLLD